MQLNPNFRAGGYRHGLTQIVRVMKITTVLLLAACLTASANGKAQKVSLSLRNATLEKALAEIKRQTGYDVIYTVDVLQRARPVTIDLDKADLSYALDQCFQDQPLTYTILEKVIVVKLRPPSVGEGPVSIAVPPIDVRGRVVNEKGEPVAGATVTIKGTNNATSTDANGYFTLKGVDENATLVITGVNVEMMEWNVGGKSNLLLNAKTRVTEGEPVVVNTGYQKISPDRFTGSYTRIDSTLYHRQVSTDVLSRLDGITNGLLFDHRPGISGGGLNIQIHGISTINGPRDPLIILNNFPYTGDINSINPDDIEEITILKDAVAASIWGARAGNGVIIFTTKKGKYNQPFKFSYTSRVTIAESPRLFTRPLMSTSDFIDLEQFLFSKGNRFSDTTLASRPAISPVYEILYKLRRGEISQQQADAQIDALRSIDVRNDLDKLFYGESINQNHALNISGGTNVFSYMVSAGYNDIRGGSIGKKSERYTFITSSSLKPSKNLEFLASINFTQSTDKNPGNISLPSYPYSQLADAEGNALVVDRMYRSSYTDTAGAGVLLDWKYKPLEEVRNGYTTNNTQSQYILMNFGARLKLTNWLSGEMKYQYSRQINTNRLLQKQASFYTRNIINRFTEVNGNLITRNIPLGGILDISNNTLNAYNLRGQLDANKLWAGKHQLTGLLGAEIRSDNYFSNSSRYYGYDDNNLQTTNVDYINLFPVYGGLGSASRIEGNFSLGEGINRAASFFTNVSYSFLSRYTFYASARKDGANVFGVNTNNKWKPLWSAGMAWEISKESFFSVDWMPFLKIRASYGSMGNTNNSISALSTIQYSGFSNYTLEHIAVIVNPANPDLRWEKVAVLNAGIDFSTSKNRISGTIEIYQKRSSDLLQNVPLDPTNGFGGAMVNAANLKGAGFDIQLNTKNIVGAFNWESSITYNRVRVVVSKYFLPQTFFSIGSFAGSNTINPRAGQLAWGFYSYQWAGLNPLTGAPQGFLNKQISTDYFRLLQDSLQNGVFHGSSVPLSFGNVLNNFRWKNLSLSVNITYRLNFYFRKSTINYSGLLNSPNTTLAHIDYTNRWQSPGDESITNVPSMIYPANSDRDGFYGASEVTALKGDHIRLQDIRLSYKWTSMKNTSAIKSIEFFAMAGNLGILWKANKAGIDPDYQNMLPSRNFSFGLSTNF